MSRFVIDIEANGLDPDKIWVIILKNKDSGHYFEWHYSNNKSPNKNFIDLLYFVEYYMTKGVNITELIGHHIINYDLPVLKRITGWTPPTTCRVTDTLVLSRLLQPDREGGHSLREWGLRFGYPKGDVTDFSQFTSAMVDYCRNDIDLTHKLYESLQLELSTNDHDWSQAIELEHDIARIITEQEQNGFYFDVRGARNLLSRITDRLDQLDQRIGFPKYSSIRPGTEVSEPFKADGSLKMVVRKYFNMDERDRDTDLVGGPFTKLTIEKYNNNSNPQLKEWLVSNGWEPDEHTPKGSPKITEASLRKMGGVGEAIVERGVWVHRERLIRGLIDNVREDGRISAGANTIGTPTGRMRHSRIVNIPGGHAVLGRDIRSLFTVQDGKVLVGYDAEQLELRILAHYIGDEDYINVILHDDPHTFASDSASLNNRQLGKTLNYAFIYGAGDAKIGSLVGGGIKEGRAIRASLYSAIPGLERLIRSARKAAKRGYVIGLDGRKMWLRDEHKALNTLIQGGGAICMKKIAQILDKKVDKSQCMKVCDMHDEAQWEVEPSYVEKFTELVHESFVECTHHFQLKCPLAGEVKPGRTWAETH